MKKKLLGIVRHFGIRNQLKKLNEECYELIEAVSFRDNKEHIIEELADTFNLLLQIQSYFDITTEELRKQLDFKIDRTYKEYNIK